MKTQFAIMTALLMTVFGLKAQTGEILFNDLDPDPYLHPNLTHEEMCFDLDFDSIPDLRMHYYIQSVSLSFYMTAIQDNLSLCRINNGDTIPNAEDWRHEWNFVNPDNYEYWGFRFDESGNYYYGWLRTYGNPTERNWYLDMFAFCTIQDYPIVCGQTSLLGVEEAEDKTFATIHPNPTTGLVTVAGENLKQAEILNTLGQVVATAQGNGHSLTMDIGHLPASIYFVSITDETGRKCVRKVVKE